MSQHAVLHLLNVGNKGFGVKSLLFPEVKLATLSTLTSRKSTSNIFDLGNCCSAKSLKFQVLKKLQKYHTTSKLH